MAPRWVDGSLGCSCKLFGAEEDKCSFEKTLELEDRRSIRTGVYLEGRNLCGFESESVLEAGMDLWIVMGFPAVRDIW